MFKAVTEIMWKIYVSEFLVSLYFNCNMPVLLIICLISEMAVVLLWKGLRKMTQTEF